MPGETSGPDEHEVRMIALERKFDELLNFVHLMVKQDSENENRRKDDDKDTNDKVLEGHPHTNASPPPRPPTPPRPVTPPKPEGGKSSLDSKINHLEKKIRLMQGLNSFGNTDFPSMS